MEFSENYCVRKEKMATLQVPNMCEVNAQLGKPLAEVFFNSCPQPLPGKMALKPLRGPGSDLWVSPSDILIDKVVLKPPLTLKYMRALTHQALLEIGREIESKYYRVLEEQKQKELDELEELLLFMAEKERNNAVQEAISKEHEIFREKLMQLNEEFAQLLQDELLKLEAHLKQMYEELFEERTRNMLEEQEGPNEARIAEAVNEATELLTKKFLDDLEQQEKFLTEIFHLKLTGQKEKYKKLLKNEQEVFETLLKQLKHNLQCNNISNLMYVLCIERRNCLRDKQEIINEYDEKIKGLEKTVSIKTGEIAKLTKERDLKQRQSEIRELCLQGVLQQFQRFINFTLNAMPAQAEFLLNVNKMMNFELTQTLLQDSLNQHKCKQVMPWRTPSELSNKTEDMLLPDYHNCLNEVTPGKNTQGNGGEGSLLAFNFNNHMYVREDFRNRVSQGFLVRPSSMIWNKDVEHLVQLLRTSFQKDVASIEDSIQKQRSHNSSVHFNSLENADLISASLERQDSAKVGLLGAVDSVILQKSIRSHPSIYDGETSPSYNSRSPGCAILAAQDSLTIAKMDSIGKSVNRECGLVNEITRDSQIFRTISTATLHLPKPLKKSDHAETSDFRNISNATIHLREGKKPEQSVYTYKSDSHKIFDECGERKKNTVKSELKSKRSLSYHRNSLEVIKERLYKKHSHIKNLLRVSYEELSNPGHFALDIPAESKKLDVNFKNVATLYSELILPDKVGKIYKPNVSSKSTIEAPARDDFLTKPNQAKIVGKIATEQAQTKHDFTGDRLDSIIDILKKDKSLIRMFTNCAQ